MIESFGNRAARLVWDGQFSKELPEELHQRALVLMKIMHYSARMEDLRIKGEPPTIRLHKLKGNRKDQWSITIQLPWCITFKFKDGRYSDVKVENYHKG